jgi:hypothetical protein
MNRSKTSIIAFKLDKGQRLTPALTINQARGAQTQPKFEYTPKGTRGSVLSRTLVSDLADDQAHAMIASLEAGLTLVVGQLPLLVLEEGAPESCRS